MNEFFLTNENDNTYSNQCRNVVCAIDNFETQISTLNGIKPLPFFHRFVWFLIKRLRGLLVSEIVSVRRYKNETVSSMSVHFLPEE